jgi:hypothetical protein
MQQLDRNHVPELAWSFGVGEQDGRSRHRTDVEARDVPLDGNIFSAVRCWLSGQYCLLFLGRRLSRTLHLKSVITGRRRSVLEHTYLDT